MSHANRVGQSLSACMRSKNLGGTMLRTLVSILTLSITMSAQAYYAEFTNESLIPPDSQIQSVETHLYDLVKQGFGGECGDTQCYRLDVMINGKHVARWMVSPGKPHPGTSFRGGYTPSYPNGTPYSRKKRMGRGYRNYRGDPMPWAAFWLRNDRGTPVIATHCGRVTGRRESHGCVRMICKGTDENGRARNDAKRVNQWVKAAQQNGGTATAYTQHTRP